MVLKRGFTVFHYNAMFQLFSENVHALDVTQIASTSTQSVEQSAKRRRLESGWEALRNFIASAGQSPKLVPW